MGQKTNPAIFQLTKNNDWQFKNIECTKYEHSIYSKEIIEVEKFIHKKFNDNYMTIHKCKLSYLNNLLAIQVQYCTNLDFNIKDVKKTYDTKVTNFLMPFTDFNKYKTDFKTLKNVLLFNNKNNVKGFKTDLLKSLYSITSNKFKIILITKNLNQQKSILNTIKLIKRINKIKRLSLKNKVTNLKNFNKKAKNPFLLKSKNKRLAIKTYEENKKHIAKFFKFKDQNNFSFFNSINQISELIRVKKYSSTLLAELVVLNLQKDKRHNFFLRFVKKCLKTYLLHPNSVLKGIKIKVKGRINTRPRAKSQVLKIGKEIPILSFDSNVNYAEKTAFTPNGTLCVKIWVY
uniref:ribosomal protein S3 n=1 Tax=Cocconeiopsis kantsiensis TaxID=3082010 RepID=UPI003001A990